MFEKEDIVVFLGTNQQQHALKMQPLSEIKKFLESEGCVHLPGEGDTNGWQVDFCEYFSYKDKKIRLSGSLWYGQFSLSRDE